MVSITFSDLEDFEFMTAQLTKVTDHPKRVKSDREALKVSIAIEPYDTRMCYLISQCLALLGTTYEKRWMDQLLKSTYYFQDQDEIAEISAIARNIGDGNIDDIPGASRYSNRHDLLLEAAVSCIEQGGTISFDSFLRFRTGPYRSLLASLIGEAIDEYKLEQEYQNFVQALRILLKSRDTVTKRAILVFNGSYHLYNATGQVLTCQEGLRIEDLPNGLSVEDIDPDILLPLLVAAPEEIHFYTDDNEEGLAQTIRNVFEERIYFFPYCMSKILFSGNH
ncbi:sporulation protein YtxC [Guptibacillus hwajinpoensis]|uniref:Sporulation protein YtxC n=1 Tax=Guptibacillus hwajinpoensis TaxID=208199 RepID=A0A0J6CW93_9BACL|nr:sporulation protein YtxC [Alkalihalobacillus macyae]KMM37435.1 hypothetical protein AB986_16430 [Alkalihalobacillus macyae]